MDQLGGVMSIEKTSLQKLENEVRKLTTNSFERAKLGLTDEELMVQANHLLEKLEAVQDMGEPLLKSALTAVTTARKVDLTEEFLKEFNGHLTPESSSNLFDFLLKNTERFEVEERSYDTLKTYSKVLLHIASSNELIDSDRVFKIGELNERISAYDRKSQDTEQEKQQPDPGKKLSFVEKIKQKLDSSKDNDITR